MSLTTMLTSVSCFEKLPIAAAAAAGVPLANVTTAGLPDAAGYHSVVPALAAFGSTYEVYPAYDPSLRIVAHTAAVAPWEQVAVLKILVASPDSFEPVGTVMPVCSAAVECDRT